MCSRLGNCFARFSFDQDHAFGFEGNHGHVYITNYLTGRLGKNIKYKTAAEIGLKEATPFTFEVILLRKRGKRQSYPTLFERRPGELWATVWQGRTFIKLREADFAQ